MTRKARPVPDIVIAARQLRFGMQHIDDGISQVAAAAGRFMALRDNEAGTETLSSIEADQVFQLVGNLTKAYRELADFLSKLQ